ncbi:hypothetical protein [Ruminococcus albus]|uniref:Uncharacterized protein n=1 Tax=Ruminococcus albus TaxID=1264 RepID=A0A1H7JFN5_RUMAL|nr:hypothetical protein [Ruminococcus albus]SEK72780.1 hypothetical protein SAMN05216469_10519 [Ruminococcus albus]
MRKLTRITALVFALCFCAAAMTACGDSDTDKAVNETSKSASADDIKEEDLDAALDKLEKDTAEELEKEKQEAAESAAAAAESEAEPVVEEIKYEATEEIKNASFRSGYIQIGDTVFRNGGYITVADFVEKYGDKYDMSEIHLDEYLTPEEQKNSFVPSLTDTRITLEVSYGKVHAEENERVQIKDAIVSSVSIKDDAEGLCYYPTGVYAMDYDTAKSCIIDMGLEEIKEVGFTVLDNDAYIEQTDNFYTDIDGDEENLYGIIPKYFYIFQFDTSTLKGTKIYIDKLWL